MSVDVWIQVKTCVPDSRGEFAEWCRELSDGSGLLDASDLDEIEAREPEGPDKNRYAEAIKFMRKELELSDDGYLHVSYG